MNSPFTEQLIRWQRLHGRNDLPWQCRDPYKIWLSEIMLQQTQVATVRAYYTRFVGRFPTVADLSRADEDEVLSLWAGLGYYSRARNLHHAARQIMDEFGGQFPRTRQELETLKGVGRSTAAAIAAFAFRQPETILDGNVRRVLCRVFALDGSDRDQTFIRHLWHVAEQLLPEDPDDLGGYIQGLMDLGATVCTRKPHCAECPQNTLCRAFLENRVHELPHPKIAPVVREIAMYWACIRDDRGGVYLEKRPVRGIWGGMWCVPCFDAPDALVHFCATHALIREAVGKPFTHRLTHRLLNITPYFFRLPEGSELSMTASEDVAVVALPKPLAVLLDRMSDDACF